MEWGKPIIQTVYMIKYRCEGFKLNRRGGHTGRGENHARCYGKNMVFYFP